jgi:hypothetical protein
MRKNTLIVGLNLLLLSLPVIVVAEDPQETDSNWLDSSHRYVHNSTDQLAGWIDQFFGVPRTDLESAHSSLRLILENNWQEGEGNSDTVRLRGKIHLPRVNERLSLLFEDEEGANSQTDSSSGISALNDNNDRTDVGLSYKAWEHLQSRVDIKVGLRSSGKGKVKARYRFESPWGENYTNRFIETLSFIDGEGFGSHSRYELDRRIDDHRLIRWSNNLTFAEESQGVEWSTRLLLGDRLNEKTAISYFVWTSGETRPAYLTTSYGLGARYRQSIIRPWIFYELEPGYAWLREESEDQRDGRITFSVRLEMLFERKSRRKRSVDID